MPSVVACDLCSSRLSLLEKCRTDSTFSLSLPLNSYNTVLTNYATVLTNYATVLTNSATELQ